MLVLRPVVCALLCVSLLAGCSLYGYKYRLWEKANASDAELSQDLAACGPESRVGSVEGNPDPEHLLQAPRLRGADPGQSALPAVHERARMVEPAAATLAEDPPPAPPRQ